MSAWITLDQALELYRLVEGVEPVVRDMGALDSSLHRPSAAYQGTGFYRTVDEKASAILESINRNHPLADGNKSLSWILVNVLYAAVDRKRNESVPPASVDLFIRGIARHEVSFEEIAVWLGDVFQETTSD